MKYFIIVLLLGCVGFSCFKANANIVKEEKQEICDRIYLTNSVIYQPTPSNPYGYIIPKSTHEREMRLRDPAYVCWVLEAKRGVIKTLKMDYQCLEKLGLFDKLPNVLDQIIKQCNYYDDFKDKYYDSKNIKCPKRFYSEVEFSTCDNV